MYVLKISTTILTNFSPSPHFSTIAQRHVSSIAAQDCVYVTNQGSVKSEVPWVQGYFWGCWFVDGRRADQTWGLLSYHDHGNLTVSNVQFFTWWLLVSFFEAWFFPKERKGREKMQPVLTWPSRPAFDWLLKIACSMTHWKWRFWFIVILSFLV